jgi:hypothetical protein
MKESPGRTCYSSPSTYTSLMQLNYSPKSVNINRLSSAHIIRDAPPIFQSHTVNSRGSRSMFYQIVRILLLYDVTIVPTGVSSYALG